MNKIGLSNKPLGIKTYGSIPHLPNSRMGSGDHHCSPGQARIACETPRDRHDRIIVQEKLDGSCVGVAKVNGKLLALGRAGYLASSSKFEMHQMFDRWVTRNEKRFSFLQEGERLCGEWLAQAHGTRYDLTNRLPFVPFDLFRENQRITVEELYRLASTTFMMPPIISEDMPLSIVDALKKIKISQYGAIDQVEGCVWRVERKGKVDFLCKYVRLDKIDGCYLPRQDKPCEPIWNWKEEEAL